MGIGWKINGPDLVKINLMATKLKFLFYILFIKYIYKFYDFNVSFIE